MGTIEPTIDPTFDPTQDPTVDPTSDPTINPSANPTVEPTFDPSVDPTTMPTKNPTMEPTVHPSHQPTMEPIMREESKSILEHIESFKLVILLSVTGVICCIMVCLFVVLGRKKQQQQRQQFTNGKRGTSTYDLVIEEGGCVSIPSEMMKTKTRIESYSTLQNTIEAIQIGGILTTQLDEVSEDTMQYP